MPTAKPLPNPEAQQHAGPQSLANRRRSTRIWHQTNLLAWIETTTGESRADEAQTFAVNAHGGLLTLKNAMDQGQSLVLENPATKMKGKCRVPNIQDPGEGYYKVGFAFEEATPLFWAVAHPPDDWGIPKV